jgi:hypothetical protein
MPTAPLASPVPVSAFHFKRLNISGISNTLCVLPSNDYLDIRNFVLERSAGVSWVTPVRRKLSGLQDELAQVVLIEVPDALRPPAQAESSARYALRTGRFPTECFLLADPFPSFRSLRGA